MKTAKFLPFILGLTLLAVGCNKIEKILPKKDGTWKAVQEETKYYTNGTYDSTDTNVDSLFTYTFEKDGNGTYTNGVENGTYTWTVNDDNDVVTICEVTGGITACISFDVLESTKETQKWMSSFTNPFDETQTQEYTLDLERVE